MVHTRAVVVKDMICALAIKEEFDSGNHCIVYGYFLITPIVSPKMVFLIFIKIGRFYSEDWNAGKTCTDILGGIWAPHIHCIVPKPPPEFYIEYYTNYIKSYS